MVETMFENEEHIVRTAESVLARGGLDEEAEAAYRDLLDGMRKLLRQSKRLVTMGDRMQGQLNALNEDLYRVARTDALTGLRNRRHFMELARREVLRARRTGEPLSLLLLDADHFKRINDTWGHDVGDLVLREVADGLRESVREVDVSARIGGEEFVALLPGADCCAAHAVAERIRERVAETFVISRGEEVRCTVSIGCTTQQGDGVDLELLLRNSDVALYGAKKKGRDCIVVYPGRLCPQEENHAAVHSCRD